MSSFHHRYYRYVRMMLRRYPKMRNEAFGRRGNAGTRAGYSATSNAFLDRWSTVSREHPAAKGAQELPRGPPCCCGEIWG